MTTTTKRKPAEPEEPPRYLTFEMAAERLHQSPKTLRNKASRGRPGDLPPLYRVGGRTLMVESELHAWVRANKVKARY